jgi:hypothetical protein
MKRFMPVFVFLGLLTLPAAAQVRWGARIGIVDGEPMVGGDVILKIGSNLYFNPGLELSGYGFTANADAHYDIELSRDAAFWVGAGVAMITPEGRDLDVGVNLLVGLGTKRGRYIFYTQVKRTSPTEGGGFGSAALGVRF